MSTLHPKKISHHPHDDLIYSYASGSNDEALNLILSTHMHHCDECQNLLQSAEHLFGCFFAELQPETSATESLDKNFESLWQSLPDQDTINIHPPQSHGHKRPSPLDIYLDKNKDRLQVKNSFPNILETVLPLSNKDVKVSLLEIAAGTEVPQHTHHGFEITQILSGGFYDQQSEYHKGDLTIKDQNDHHAPHIFDDAPCKCLVVRYGSLKFTGPMRFIYNPIFRLLD